ncbi:MAG: hypothetical protein E2604_11580 [Flavobacterium sp.]|nr:hypothetical protein [Flavobacterium sp.]
MDQLKQRILEIFREFKTPVNGILKPQSVEGRIRNWDRRSQDDANEAINELISEEYIGVKDNWYTLTQKGYNHLNEDYSITDTENIILNFLKSRNLKAGDVIMPNWFNSLLQNIGRVHFDNFNTALQNVIHKGIIEVRSNNDMFFTQKGYDELY